MSNLAIHTENLGKRYRLGATVDFSRTFREALLGLPKYFYHLSKIKAKSLLDKDDYPKDTPKGTFWALKDINLDIQHGDVVGIIGRNGAGKSTLLKILSKITSPTTGIARINGRVGSLLEVGTGFHPELTGRENIFLNGSILGMRKAEIEKKFDEIVAFAEVEQFLDTPIKRYSSGMQVRLAFAVAAHLEPEILIVDEVLAVGDASFQKKCLGKMEDVSKEGRTVLFVSHNMGAVQKLCKSSILLKEGKEILKGNTEFVINEYLSLQISHNYDSRNLAKVKREKDTWGKKLTIKRATIFDSDGQPSTQLKLGESFSIFFTAKAKENLKDISFILGIDSIKRDCITTVGSEELEQLYHLNKDEEITLKATFNNIILNVGFYSFRIGARIGKEAIDLIYDAITFEITSIRDDKALHYIPLDGIICTTPEWKIVNE